MKSSQYLKAGTSFFTILICSINIVFLQKESLKQQKIANNKSTYLQEEKAFKSAIKFQKSLPTFGLNNLVADWNYLQFIQYFGDAEAREVTGYSLVTDYFEVAVDKDPYFTQSFLSFSAANSLFAGQPKKTVKLINRVLENASPDLPGYPFLLWTYKATDEILFLGNLGAAKDSYERAAEWAAMRDDDVGREMAKRYRTSANYLASNPNSIDARIGAWTNVLSQAQDTKTQQHAINELEKLGVEINITEEGQINILRSNKT